MNNNPMGYNQGMDSNVFGMNVLRNDGTASVEANPTLNLLNQSSNQFGGTSTGNPTLDLLNQGNGGMPQNNNQFYNSGNPTLDLLNESNNAPENNYNFVAPTSEAPVEQPPGGGSGTFSFLSENENQAMIRAQVNETPMDNNMMQPVQQPAPQPMMQPTMQQPMNFSQPVPEPTPQQPMNFVTPTPEPVMQQPVVQPQPNAYGFVPMMNQQPAQQPVQQPAPQPVMNVPAAQPVQQQAQVNNIGTIDNLNFSFIPLREEAPAPTPQPVMQPVNQPDASQVFGQAQVMQQPMQQPMMQQGMPMGQPMMGGFQPTTGVVQQSLDTLFPTGTPDGNGNFPQ